jgi:type I restriction enzyme, S subunit
MCMASGSPQVLGKSARLTRSFVGSVGAFCGIIRPRIKADSEYIAHWLRSPGFVAWRDVQARGVNIQNLRISELADICLPWPNGVIRRSVDQTLKRADHLRRLRRYALELSEPYLQTVFVEMFGPQFTNHEGQTPLGSLVQITGGGTPAREIPRYYQGAIPWLTSKDMHGDYIWDTEEHITEEAIANSATKLVPAGSILVVVKSKVLMHRLPIAIAETALCHGQDIKSIQCCDKVDRQFLVQVLKHNERRLLLQARGANTEGLTLPMLHEIPVPDVPLDAQRHFARVARRHARLRSQQGEALRQAEHLFQTLLDRAFKGELLNDDEARS